MCNKPSTSIAYALPSHKATRPSTTTSTSASDSLFGAPISRCETGRSSSSGLDRWLGRRRRMHLAASVQYVEADSDENGHDRQPSEHPHHPSSGIPSLDGSLVWRRHGFRRTIIGATDDREVASRPRASMAGVGAYRPT